MMDPRMAKRELRKCKEEGKRALSEYDKHQRSMAMTEAGMLKLQKRIGALDAKMRSCPRPHADAFPSEAEILRCSARLEQLKDERTKLAVEYRDLTSVIMHHKLDMVKLAAQIEKLRRSQRNLEAVAAGQNPASGFEGGLFYISGT
jgi:chromosome segregation ATPase